MATNLPYCFFIQFLEQLVNFLVNFTLLKYVKSQRSYGFLTTKELIFGFQILDLKDHFSASLNPTTSSKLGNFVSSLIRGYPEHSLRKTPQFSYHCFYFISFIFISFILFWQKCGK